MAERHIYKNETDWFSAESAEEANRLYCEMIGYKLGDLDEDSTFKEPPLPDEEMLEIPFIDGAEDNRDYPAWVDDEPEATVSDFQYGKFPKKQVSAPMRIWAKHESGIVCSTEF